MIDRIIEFGADVARAIVGVAMVSAVLLFLIPIVIIDKVRGYFASCPEWLKIVGTVIKVIAVIPLIPFWIVFEMFNSRKNYNRA